MSFSDEMLADCSVFLADFGQAITVGAATITGIFDGGSAPFRTESGEMVYDNPQAVITTADAVAQGIDKGTELTIDSLVYKVAAPPRPDGTGLTALELVRYDE